MTVVINVYDIKGERIMNKKFTLELTNRIKHLQSNLVREELDAYILTAEEVYFILQECHINQRKECFL